MNILFYIAQSEEGLRQAKFQVEKVGSSLALEMIASLLKVKQGLYSASPQPKRKWVGGAYYN